MGPKRGHLGRAPEQSQEAGAILKALVSKMAPRWLKTSPNSPRQPLGSLLGSSEAVLEGLGPPKTLKTNCFSRFLQMQVFGTLKLLMVLLGPSWLLLGRSGPKMGPKMVPQMPPNRPQNHLKEGRGKLNTIKNVELLLMLGLGFKMVPRWLKMAPSSPRQPLGTLLGSSEAVLDSLAP